MQRLDRSDGPIVDSANLQQLIEVHFSGFGVTVKTNKETLWRTFADEKSAVHRGCDRVGLEIHRGERYRM